MPEKSFKALLEDARSRDAFHVEKAILQFTSDLHQLMKNRGFNKADLARTLGTSPAYLTKVFRGDANFTIESMVKLSRALTGQLHLHVAPQEAEVRWVAVHVLSARNQAANSSVWGQKNLEPAPSMKETTGDGLEPVAA